MSRIQNQLVCLSNLSSVCLFVHQTYAWKSSTFMPNEYWHFSSVWCKIGLLWAEIKYLKNTTALLPRKYDYNQRKIFVKRYCGSLWVKRLQRYKPSKLEVKKIANPTQGIRFIVSAFRVWYYRNF